MNAPAKLPAWLEMNPANRRAVAATAGLLVLAVAVVFALLLPAVRAHRELAKVRAEAATSLDALQAKIRQTPEQLQETEALEAELAALRESGVLEPLLASYEMRGMSLLNPIAASNGVTLLGGNVRRLSQLPIDEKAPPKGAFFARQPLEFTASGSYDALAAFIRDIERTLPMAAVSSLRIVAQAQNAEVQEMTIGIEWPVVAPKPADPKEKGK